MVQERAVWVQILKSSIYCVKDLDQCSLNFTEHRNYQGSCFVLKLDFLLIFIGVQLLSNVVLLLYSKGTQLIAYPLFFGFLSHLGQHRALNRAPCYAVCSQQLSILYIASIVCVCWTQLSILPNTSFPPFTKGLLVKIQSLTQQVWDGTKI